MHNARVCRPLPPACPKLVSLFALFQVVGFISAEQTLLEERRRLKLIVGGRPISFKNLYRTTLIKAIPGIYNQLVDMLLIYYEFWNDIKIDNFS